MRLEKLIWEEAQVALLQSFISLYMKIEKQVLHIPAEWEIVRNEFYDIDPFDQSSVEDKDTLIFDQEDMLWIRKGDYNIDLGWYGGNKLSDSRVGYCLYLYRGISWNKCELLEKYKSQNKTNIVDRLVAVIASIDHGEYESLKGYVINEDDSANRNSMSDHEFYSAKN
jgi:hypothetical protein